MFAEGKTEASEEIRYRVEGHEIMKEGLRAFASLERGCLVLFDVVPVLVFSIVTRYESFSATAEPMTSAGCGQSEMRNQWAQQVLSSPANGHAQESGQGTRKIERRA